jgi:hypothetical protein
MSTPRTHRIRRYTAYFMGWCQAFGMHEFDYNEQSELRWLFGEDRLGLIFSRELKRAFFREVLLREGGVPELMLAPDFATVGEVWYRAGDARDREGLKALIDMVDSPGDTHMFLSYHFCYPPGTRIVTFTKKGPLGLLYKEMAPIQVAVVDEDPALQAAIEESGQG